MKTIAAFVHRIRHIAFGAVALLIAGCTMPIAQPPTPALSGNAIRVESAMSRPAPAGGNGAAYFTVVNPTGEADRLIAAQSAVARVSELHETTEENGVMRMVPHPEGFEVPARSVVELVPGGKHVMLLELAEPLEAGDEIALTLTFESAGAMEIVVPVMEMAGAAMPSMDHGDMAGGEGGMAAGAVEPKLTDNGLFRVRITSQMDPVVINEIHSWTIHVETAEGDPVDGAEIAVDGGMPAHNHGFPTTPQVTEKLGGGDYLLEGVRFNMAGAWVMDLSVTAGGQSDTVRFEFELP